MYFFYDIIYIMPFLTFVTQSNIIEGIVGASIYPILLFLIRFVLSVDRFVAMAMCWYLTWICRKISVNAYRSYLKEFGLKEPSYQFNVPSWR